MTCGHHWLLIISVIYIENCDRKVDRTVKQNVRVQGRIHHEILVGIYGDQLAFYFLLLSTIYDFRLLVVISGCRYFLLPSQLKADMLRIHHGNASCQNHLNYSLGN